MPSICLLMAWLAHRLDNVWRVRDDDFECVYRPRDATEELRFQLDMEDTTPDTLDMTLIKGPLDLLSGLISQLFRDVSDVRCIVIDLAHADNYTPAHVYHAMRPDDNAVTAHMNGRVFVWRRPWPQPVVGVRLFFSLNHEHLFDGLVMVDTSDPLQYRLMFCPPLFLPRGKIGRLVVMHHTSGATVVDDVYFKYRYLERCALHNEFIETRSVSKPIPNGNVNGHFIDAVAVIAPNPDNFDGDPVLRAMQTVCAYVCTALNHSARVIQRAWRTCVTHPCYDVCKRRIAAEFAALQDL